MKPSETQPNPTVSWLQLTAASKRPLISGAPRAPALPLGEKWGGHWQAEPIPDSPSPCSTVDDNPDFDNLDIVARDEEERYFDEEEPEDAPSPELDGD